jgi:hypothetical protein
MVFFQSAAFVFGLRPAPVSLFVATRVVVAGRIDATPAAPSPTTTNGPQ